MSKNKVTLLFQWRGARTIIHTDDNNNNNNHNHINNNKKKKKNVNAEGGNIIIGWAAIAAKVPPTSHISAHLPTAHAHNACLHIHRCMIEFITHWAGVSK